MTNECTELTVDVEGSLFVYVCVCVSELVSFGDCYLHLNSCPHKFPVKSCEEMM